MKCLVTGYNGQLGYDIVKELEKNNIEAKGIDILDLDITNRDNVISYVKEYNPDVIFHCAAYTKVDAAEENKELCYNVNVNGTDNLTYAASLVGAKIIYISTDYVFNGEKESFYQVDDKVDPINYYGKTKYLGEEKVRTYPKHFIVRISWVFGINGGNFVKTMLRLANEKDEINVVSDQYGSPTYTKDLALLLVNVAKTDKYGTYHATNEGVCSWYEFTKYIFKVNDINIKVNPIETKDYKTLAKRPLNSKMDKKKLEENNFDRLPTWQDAIDRYSKELKN